MNNIKLLRDELTLTTRDIEEYTGICYSVVNLLETEKRPMREKHIQAFASFFNVTSDYLLGINKYGYIVYPKGQDDYIVISEEEYLKYRRDGKVKLEYVKLNSFETTIIEDGKEPKILFQPPYQLIREIDFGEIENKRRLLEELNDLGNQMSDEQLYNTIDFIKKYIL